MEDKLFENEYTEEAVEPKEETLEPEEVDMPTEEEQAFDTPVEETEECSEEVIYETTEDDTTEDDTTEDAEAEYPAETEEIQEEAIAEPEITVAPVVETVEEIEPEIKKEQKPKKTHSFSDSNEDVQAFSKKVKVQRIIDKICLALLLVAIGIPVALLGYIIYTIVSFFI
jgi:hypothetical protein